MGAGTSGMRAGLELQFDGRKARIWRTASNASLSVATPRSIWPVMVSWTFRPPSSSSVIFSEVATSITRGEVTASTLPSTWMITSLSAAMNDDSPNDRPTMTVITGISRLRVAIQVMPPPRVRVRDSEPRMSGTRLPAASPSRMKGLPSSSACR